MNHEILSIETSSKIARLERENQKYRESWQRLREMCFAVMHYTNELNCDEVLKYMEELEEELLVDYKTFSTIKKSEGSK